MIRRAIVLIPLVLLAACQSDPYPQAPRRVAADLPPLPQVAPEQMFGDAIEDICFEALARGQLPHFRMAYVDFEEAGAATHAFRSTPADTVYRARNVSSPVLVSVAPGIARCDVVAVKGDPAALRKAAESKISAFDKRGLTGIADYLAAIDRSPRYAMKFTLRTADMVGDYGGLSPAAEIADDNNEFDDDPFAVTE